MPFRPDCRAARVGTGGASDLPAGDPAGARRLGAADRRRAGAHRRLADAAAAADRGRARAGRPAGCGARPVGGPAAAPAWPGACSTGAGPPPLVEPSAARAGDVTVVIPRLRPGRRARAHPRGPRQIGHGSRQVVPPAVPVVVVDDGSPDRRGGRPRAAARRPAPGSCGGRPTGGPGAARNSGLRGAHARSWPSSTRDVEPGSRMAGPAAAPLRRPGGRPPVRSPGGSPGPRRPAVLAANRPVGSVASVDRRPDRPLRAGPVTARPRARPARVAPRTRVAYVPTTTLVGARSTAIEAVGGVRRVARASARTSTWSGGWSRPATTVRYEPAAIVTHPTRPDAGAWLRQRFDYGRSAAAARPLATPRRWRRCRCRPGARRPGRLAAAGAPGRRRGGGRRPPSSSSRAGSPASSIRGRRALRLAGGGTWAAWRPLASAVTRTWWPAALVAAGASPAGPPGGGGRRAGPAAGRLVAGRALGSTRCATPRLRLLDDVAYGAGVWAGCRRQRHDRSRSSPTCTRGPAAAPPSSPS